MNPQITIVMASIQAEVASVSPVSQAWWSTLALQVLASCDVGQRVVESYGDGICWQEWAAAASGHLGDPTGRAALVGK